MHAKIGAGHKKWLVFDLGTKAWSAGAQTEGIQVLVKEHSLFGLENPKRERQRGNLTIYCPILCTCLNILLD
jgi:hypothetical protein